MKLATADLHLTSSPADDYRWGIFRQLESLVEKKHIDDLLILGDLTEKKDGHNAALVNRLCNHIERLRRRCRVHILSGNHDYTDEHEPYFGFLRRFDNVRFYRKPTIGKLGDANCLFLPHARGFRRTWEAARGNLCAKQAPHLVFFHQAVAGAAGDNGHTFGEEAGNVTKADLALFRGAVFVAGDIHTPQEIEGVWYCGGPHPVDYGDAYDPRVILIDDDCKRTSIPVEAPRKETIVVRSEEDLRSKLQKFHNGDMIKIEARLARQHFVDWPALRELSSFLAHSRGVTIGGISLTERVRPKARNARERIGGDITTPGKVLLEYMRGISVDSRFTRMGVQLMAELTGRRHDPYPGLLVPLKLAVEGFRSFRTKQVFKFGKPGLYALTGRNESNPRMGANACGKSSLWDGLTYCCHGKTARGLAGTDAATWGSKRTKVSFKFAKRGREYTLTRQRGPNRLTLTSLHDGTRKDISQEEIDAWLGNNYEGFLSTVLMGQFNQFFFDLSATEKLNQFSAALNLEVWLDAAQAAKGLAKDQAACLDIVRTRINRAEGSLAELTTNVETINGNLLVASKARKTKINAATKVLNELASAALAKEEIAKDAARALDVWNITYAEQTKKLEGLDNEHRQLERRVDGLRRDVQQAKDEHARCLAAKNKFTGKCPTCGRELKEQKIKEHKGLLRNAYRMAADAVFSFQQGLRDDKALLQKVTDRMDRLNEKMNRTEREQASGKKRLATANDKYRSMEERAGQARAVVAALETASDVADLEKMYGDAKARLTTVQDELEADRIKAKTVDSELDGYDFWANEFKAVRLWLANKALEELSIEVNNNLIELDLAGWSVSFVVEKENKSGGTTKGFSVLIQSPDHKEPVRWEAWSGGETQRLRVAGAKGLANLIRARKGTEWALEVWDEPTAHLSEEGTRSLVDLLRAKSGNKQVWVIDHRPTVSHGQFDGSATIVKWPDAGSVIEQTVST